MKSILNNTPAPPNEVSDIVNTIQNDNPVKSLSRIMNIYTQAHLYLNQWKALRVEMDCLKRIIAMIRRYEASGLQLDGKGLWLLSMILEYSCDDLVIDSATFTVLFDTLLRVGVETSAYTICTSMLLLLVNKFQASSYKLFQTGYEIADHLPDHIPADNFIALLNLGLTCMTLDRTCTLLACKFLVCLAANVTPNHKVNYFLSSVVGTLGDVFISPTQVELADTERKHETEVYVLILLAYFAPLYPTHAQIIMNHSLSLPINVVHRLSAGTLSEGGESAALLFLDSLCIDNGVKDELKTLVSIDLLRSKMSVSSPTVTEKATKLFLSLYANDIECNYRARSSVDLRGSPNLRKSVSSANLRNSVSWGAGAGVSASSVGGTAADHEEALMGAFGSRSDCSWSISGVTCLRDLLSIVLNITEGALSGSSGGSGGNGVGGTVGGGSSSVGGMGGSGSGKNNAFGNYGSMNLSSRGSVSSGRNPERSSAIEWSPAKTAHVSSTISSSAAFHYMNSIVYQVGLCVQIHRIHSLHDIVARIVALLLAEFENMSAFDLKNAKIIDTLFILLGVRERCWLPYPTSPVDADFMQLSVQLQEHFVSVADPVVTSSSDTTLPYTTETRDYTTSNLLNSKVFSYAKDRILRESKFLDAFLEDWELETIEVVSRKILLVYCILQLHGLEVLYGMIDIELFQEMLWDVLSDERHGINDYPEMKRKCIQLFTLLGMQLGSPVSGSPRQSMSSVNTSTRTSISANNSPANPNTTTSATYNTTTPPSSPPLPLYNPALLSTTTAVELANAAHIAEFVIKILTSHEHAGASDEEDDIDIAAMFGSGGNNTYINTTNNTTTNTADNTTTNTANNTTNTDTKSEGGKCVSRIFRTHKHNVQLRYSCLSCIMHVCEKNRAIRRKVIAHYSDISSNFAYLDPVRSMSPLLQLVALASEYLSKVESAGEESIVTLLVRCLRCPDSIVRTLACEVISVIGTSSPGLMHRGICRPEVEHLLIDILHDSCNSAEQHTGPLVCSVLKACNALTHDINVRPCWVPSPYTYHWSHYTMNLALRPLFCIDFLTTLQTIVRKASRAYMIQYFSIVLSIITGLMYSCNDGVFAPALVKSPPNHVVDLKSALIAKFLPWMPVALDYLTSHKKIIRSMLVVPAPMHLNDGAVHSGHGGNNNGASGGSGSNGNSVSGSNGGSVSNSANSSNANSNSNSASNSRSNSTANTPTHSPVRGIAELRPSITTGNTNGTSSYNMDTTTTTTNTANTTSRSAKNSPVPTPAKATSTKNATTSGKNNTTTTTTTNTTNPTSNSTIATGLNIMSRIKRKSNANILVVENVVLPDRRQDVKYSTSAEYLAEKLIEAMYAFLCMDEMFPLSTYLQNATLFNITPVIACVSYFMTECPANSRLQRRGIDFIKHFADNQIGLSSIAMHSPGAIMHAARTLHDTLEVQYCFCRIVSAVAKSDDFARENFIRFNVQSLLIEMVLRQHVEQSRLACIALSDLCVHDTDVFSVCMNTGLVDAVIALIDSMPGEFRIQIEAIRVLVTVDQIPDMLQATRKVSVSAILKRCKKYLQSMLKQETLPDGYEKADLEALLTSPLWAKDPLLTKFLGLFG